jgi:hypothetical protein
MWRGFAAAGTGSSGAAGAGRFVAIARQATPAATTPPPLKMRPAIAIDQARRPTARGGADRARRAQRAAELSLGSVVARTCRKDAPMTSSADATV